ncbi:YceH family protein [Lysobacter arvi]|uniref:YceH family protein n=1 Tax=Lysobacter arvi TaxID=3038776 RepID=A0ABU1CEY1_9GAMM|nr:YceH family protein [Lysobacter arvi]MDR0183508.1 YceH family protein [Lysobacter arvi]
MSEDTAPLLSPTDARILASLFEKEATTPDAYPLTLNAIVLACNQKTAREPVMDLEPGEVGNALRRLETRGWVKSQHTARAERYAHRLEAVLSLTRPQTALLALLMLRGPQTAHELLSRTDRLARFEGIEDVQHALERLSRRTPALVVALARQPGQRGERFAHLLCGEPDPGLLTAAASGSGASSSPLSERVAELEQRVAELEARLVALEAGRDAG